MSARRSLRLPIALAILMIVLLVALTVGWVLLAVTGLLENSERTVQYVTLLSVGTTFLVLVLVGTVMYLLLSVKAINLNRRQSNFIDSVTHELKSPIASLKLYLQTLTRRPVETDERDAFYAFMLDDVERLDHLINHLLDAARLDRDTNEQDKQLIDLMELLTECAHSVCLRYQVPCETVDLNLQPLTIRASAVDLDMVFRNLIDNAVKYAGDPPRVEVSILPNNQDRAIVRIRDNGSGIPNKQRRKVFGRFVRLGSELERKKPGTGLGLYIVRTLVKRLKGKIHVREAQPGDGTEFEVVLPVATMADPRLTVRQAAG